MKKLLLLLLFISQWCFSQNTGIRLNYVYTSLLDVDYQKVIAATDAMGITRPSPAAIAAGNAFMIGVKADIGLSAFDNFSPFYTDAPANFALLNWINPSGSVNTTRNNPLYTNLYGFSNDASNAGASTSTLDMGAYGANFTQNNGETIIYYKGLPAATYSITAFDGTQGNTNNFAFNGINPQSSAGSGGTASIGVNEASSNSVTGFTLTDGLYFFGRIAASGAGAIFLRKESGSRVTVSTTSTGLSPWHFLLGGYSTTATAQLTSAVLRSYGFYSSGRLLTTTEEANLKTRWDTYKAAIAAITPLATIGTIYNVSSWANLNDFTSNGATVTATSNQLQFTGGANTFTQTLDLTSIGGVSIGATRLSKWTQTIKFIVPTIDASINWIGLGIRSSNFAGQLYDLVLRMDLTTGSAGILKLYTGPSHGLAVASGSALTITAGDVVSVTFSLIDAAAYYSCSNITTSTSIAPLAYGLGFLANTGHFAIFDGGGSVHTNKVTSWTISSSEIQGSRVAMIGDSKTAGDGTNGSSNLYNRHNGFFYKIQDQYGQIVNLGGQSDSSPDYVTRVYEVINWIRPQTVIIVGVRNDISLGTSAAIWQANILSLISQFQAAGIRVVYWTGLNETIVNQSASSTWANAGIGCEVWDSLPIVLTTSDGIHPNNAGHALYANYALSYGKLPY